MQIPGATQEEYPGDAGIVLVAGAKLLADQVHCLLFTRGAPVVVSLHIPEFPQRAQRVGLS